MCRSEILAMLSSCVTKITVIFRFLLICFNNEVMFSVLLLSKFPVGSSAKITDGLLIKALAIAMRWHCPPDNSEI